MSALKYWLWLSSARVSIKAKAAILERYGDAETAFFAPEGDFRETEGLSAVEASVLEKRDTSLCAGIISQCAQQNIQIISYRDAAYPKRLRSIAAPPPVIYVKGNLPAVDENAVISVIGTRKASAYGIKMSRDIAYGIAKCGGVVLSLMNSGIDYAAYKGALLAGGSCIAVLPFAHDKADEQRLADICVNGAAVSEYPPDTETQKHFFRERNRIAAGLSVGVAVIEAPEKSGTRLFAEEAAEQGKEIFALPGNADSENSAGTLAMLKDGARLITDGAELMAEFKPLFPDRIRIVKAGQAPAEPVNEERAEAKPLVRQSAEEPPAKSADLKEQLAGLSEAQLKIVMAIDSNSSHIDDIIEATGMRTGVVLGNITMLELKGIIRRESGMRISLNTAKK